MYYYILSNIFYRTYKFDRITHPWECFTSHNFQWYFNVISLCFVFHIFNSMKGEKLMSYFSFAISLSYRAPDILKMPIVVWRHQSELLGPRKGDSERLGRVGFNRGGESSYTGFLRWATNTSKYEGNGVLGDEDGIKKREIWSLGKKIV